MVVCMFSSLTGIMAEEVAMSLGRLGVERCSGAWSHRVLCCGQWCRPDPYLVACARRSDSGCIVVARVSY
jgi:hypothetical protein